MLADQRFLRRQRCGGRVIDAQGIVEPRRHCLHFHQARQGLAVIFDMRIKKGDSPGEHVIRIFGLVGVLNPVQDDKVTRTLKAVYRLLGYLQRSGRIRAAGDGHIRTGNKIGAGLIIAERR